MYIHGSSHISHDLSSSSIISIPHVIPCGSRRPSTATGVPEAPRDDSIRQTPIRLPTWQVSRWRPIFWWEMIGKMMGK